MLVSVEVLRLLVVAAIESVYHVLVHSGLGDGVIGAAHEVVTLRMIASQIMKTAMEMITSQTNWEI